MSCDMAKLNEFTGLAERVHFFDNAQGGLDAAIIYKTTFVWESGSNRDAGSAGEVGLLMDSSWYDKTNQNDMRQLLWYRIRYVEQKLDDAIKVFESAKQELTNAAHSSSIHGTPSPTPEQLKYVKRLRHKTIKWNRRLNELMAEANPEPEPIVYSPEEIAVMTTNRAKADKILNSLEKIEI